MTKGGCDLRIENEVEGYEGATKSDMYSKCSHQTPRSGVLTLHRVDNESNVHSQSVSQRRPTRTVRLHRTLQSFQLGFPQPYNQSQVFRLCRSVDREGVIFLFALLDFKLVEVRIGGMVEDPRLESGEE
jgi:hypothetical protein